MDTQTQVLLVKITFIPTDLDNFVQAHFNAVLEGETNPLAMQAKGKSESEAVQALVTSWRKVYQSEDDWADYQKNPKVTIIERINYLPDLLARITAEENWLRQQEEEKATKQAKWDALTKLAEEKLAAYTVNDRHSHWSLENYYDKEEKWAIVVHSQGYLRYGHVHKQVRYPRLKNGDFNWAKIIEAVKVRYEYRINREKNAQARDIRYKANEAEVSAMRKDYFDGESGPISCDASGHIKLELTFETADKARGFLSLLELGGYKFRA